MLLTGAALVSAEETAPPYADGPPLAHTGGFGEPTCQACHTEFDLNAPGGEVGVEGFPQFYQRGESYQLTVTVTGEGQGSAGFQLSARFAEGAARGRQAGSLMSTDLRTVVKLEERLGIEYIQHTPEGVGLDPRGRGHWTFEWRAPERAEPVSLHLVVNSGNGDNSPFGDIIYQMEMRSLPGDGR